MATIAVFGAGYAGLVTGVCFAELGHDVRIRDVVPERIEELSAGRLPFHEPGLRELIERNRERLTFTLSEDEAVADAGFVFVCVGTPPTYSGDADLSAIWSVIDSLPELSAPAVLVMKSTVPVGTGEKARAALDARGLAHVGYVSCPEFLAEGTAVRDFLEPDRIVVGSFDDADGEAVARLHDKLDAPVVQTDVPSAEMVKLAANAFLATRISFINEIANVCELVGADVEQVALGMGLDRRIGKDYLRAGIGFGGSCLVGQETVLVRHRGRVRLLSLERLYAETDEDEEVEILSWRPDGNTAEFLRVDLLTRRRYDGEIVEVRTKMGRRVRCTPDHPFVTQNGRRLAEELTTNDWVPIAQGAAARSRRASRFLNLAGAFEHAGLEAAQVIVRANRTELAEVGARSIQAAIGMSHPRGAVARSHDILRSGALRLHEAAMLDLEIEEALMGTTKNGTYIPTTIVCDPAFWRVVGLYIAEGHCPVDSGNGHHRLQWSFHPNDEEDLVQEVVRFWTDRGVKASVFRSPTSTSTIVRVSSRLLAAWWLNDLGLGANCYEQRLPDLIWSEGEAAKRALLEGLWLGDGSWSYVNRGPSVVLEYGTVSRELADGILRLLGDIGIVARLKVGRTAKSTVDTYWLVISGASQVERLLDLVPGEDRPRIVESIGRQAKRIAPTGFRRHDNAAWVRIVDVRRERYSGYVYSLEVAPTHTFVTTGGLVCSNCFPKDVSFLKLLAGNSGYSFQLINAVIQVNELQMRRPVGKLQKHLGSLRGKRIALLGLAFKPDTDDLREAPSIVLASRLLAEGADVVAWDPIADASEILHGVELTSSVLDALRDADAAVVVTDWPELRELTWADARQSMRNPLVIDGRNCLDPVALRALGFVYEGIGRAASQFAGLPETSGPERRLPR